MGSIVSLSPFNAGPNIVLRTLNFAFDVFEPTLYHFYKKPEQITMFQATQ